MKENYTEWVVHELQEENRALLRVITFLVKQAGGRVEIPDSLGTMDGSRLMQIRSDLDRVTILEVR